MKGHYKFTWRDAKTNEITRVLEKDNVICDAGCRAIAAYLGGSTTVDALPTHIAVGDDDTAATASDTVLGNETFRKALTTKSYSTSSTAILYVGTYFTTSEGNGTIEEVGLFLDATDATDSGELLSHVIDTITKTVSDTLQIEIEITLT